MQTKKCCYCKKNKPPVEFHKNRTTKDGLCTRCKECNIEVVKQYYKEHGYKNATVARAKKRINGIKIYIDTIKAQTGCKYCQEHDSCCLDFHHINGDDKLYNIGNILSRKLQTVLDEIAKCIIVCSNCHKKLHAGRNMVPSSNG